MQEIYNNYSISIPEIFLLCSALIILVLGAFLKDRFNSKIVSLSIIVALITIILLLQYPNINIGYAYNNFFYTNVIIFAAKILIMLGFIMINLMQLGDKISLYRNNTEFSVLMIFSIVGMMVMLSANDLLTLYMGLELQSLSLYILAAFDRNNAKSSEAGLKYFVLGALASGIMLYGISLIYGFTGTTNFTILEELYKSGAGVENSSAGLIIGMVFVLIGFCFKISAVPFHMWTPDVYQGAPTLVTAFLATLPKITTIIILYRFLYDPFSGFENEWKQVIILASVLSMFIGSFGALMQDNIKRMLAYSSISHVGFMLIAIATATDNGLASILLYLTIYLFMSIGTFSFVMAMKKDGKYIEDILSLKGLSKTNPIASFGIAVLMFSQAGIPPLAGFYAKFYILRAAIDSGLYFLAIAGVISSVISAFYYLRIVKFMYLDNYEFKFDNMIIGIKITSLMAVIFNLLYFLVPNWLINIIYMISIS